MRTLVLATAALLVPLPLVADEGRICVVNETGEEWIFVAHADDGERRVDTLAPGERLCSVGQNKGTVAVFATFSDIEGCSRRVAAGASERLLSFPSVDLCDWSAT